jgi:hypothetical protein
VIWKWALACFILAGLTGILFRFGLAQGLTLGFNLINVRHAHSHFMYFGWATPALMALIVARATAMGKGLLPAYAMHAMVATLVAAFIAFPLFLAFGYASVPVGKAQLPLGVIGSGLNIIGWYAFVVVYAHAMRGTARDRAVVLWDAAVVFMVFASLGAWALALLRPLGVESMVLAVSLTHVFLDLFSEGWFVLGVLGLAYASLRPGAPAGDWSLWMLFAGLPLTFPLGMPASLVPPGMMLLARLGGVLVGVGLLANAWGLLRHGEAEALRRWRLPLLLLVLKAAAQLVMALAPGVAGLFGLRVLYLHVMLLGFVSLGLVTAAGGAWGRSAASGRSLFGLAVVAMLLSLVPLSALWPVAFGRMHALTAAAWVALAPVGVAVLMLVKAVMGKRGAESAEPVKV